MADLIISGQAYTNSTTGDWGGVDIPRSSPTTFSFLNNSITSVNGSGYQLQAGDESPGSENTNLNGQIVTGNKLIWNGSITSSIITHGLFVGYNINSIVKYNYLQNVPYGIITKSGTDAGVNMIFTSGGVSYNIVKNGHFAGRVKGINGVKFYNNTFYSGDGNGWYLILITANDDRAVPAGSVGTKIKNNIFYSTINIPMIKVRPNCLTDFESDYNVFWCTAGTPTFMIDDVSKTWAQWQALGYDTHSVILNPNFIDFVNFVPATRLDYGTNLGAEFQTGLSTTAIWTLGSSPATQDQNGTWQVGARIYASTTQFIPSVTTTAISAISSITASSGGNVTSDGGDTVTARGVCWNTTGTPTISDSKTSNGTGTGSFTSSITGLTTNTLYYVRAYATNAVGTAYGAQVSFTTDSIPTVTTTSISSITTNSAISGGNVTSDGGDTVTARGVCWNTSINPTTANSKTTNGTGTGSFTSSLTSLISSTLYYVRAYATNAVGTAYGAQVSFTTSAAPGGSVYYIDPTGIDTAARNGLSTATAWKTLGYAINGRVSGDIIHVNAGTYTLPASQISIPQGVSIEGDGDTSVFLCTLTGTNDWVLTAFSILLSGGSTASHISNIKMDGQNYTAYGAIAVSSRNNTTINNCTFVNFKYWGVRFYGGEPPATPAAYMTGSVFHDNIITDCAGYYDGATQGVGSSLGCLGIGGVDGMLIYNNTIVQPANRGVTNEGEPIYGVEGFIKNVKIYNNTITKTLIVAGRWDFAIEIWNWEGGNEIYNNVITGSVDVQYATKGTSTYSAWIHDNIIGQPTLKQKQSVRGVLLEVWNSDVIIERNYIHHVAEGIYMRTRGSTVCTQSNIYIRYNVFDNIGAASGAVSPSGWGFYCSQENGTGTLPDITNNFNFYNNTIIASPTGVVTSWGISVPDNGAATDILICNNIVKNFGGAPVRMNNWAEGGASVTNLRIFNNIFYNNGNSNDPYFASGVTTTNVTGLSPQTNLKTDPQFINNLTDYHLTTARVGLYITSGLTDKDGVTVANPPTIGAYEFMGSTSIPTVTTTLISTITINSASGGGNVTADGGLSVTARGVCWNTSTNPTIVNSHTTNGTGTGVFTSSLTGLNPGIHYYVRAYAINAAGTAYGSEVTFDTSPDITLATITTSSITNIFSASATGGGTVVHDGNSNVTARGICWSTSSTPTLSNSYTIDGTGEGTFISTLINLVANTTYYVRAYATNSLGVAYGNQVSFVTTGNIFYVSVSGNDSSIGTSLTTAFKTIQRGITAITAPGDSLYIRGGTYSPTATSGNGAYNAVYISSKNGTIANEILISAYNNEVVTIDGVNITQAGEKRGIQIVNCSYIKIKGITVQNIHEHEYAGPADSIYGTSSNHITIEQCTVTKCGNGFRFNGACDYIYYINCDAYDNWDYYNNGLFANGFNANINAGMHQYMTGCRAWYNSNNGYDYTLGGGFITMTNCWAFRNGRTSYYSNIDSSAYHITGNGNGFKLGHSDKGDETGYQRILYNCLSVFNDLIGFNESIDVTQTIDMALYNSLAYNNSNDYGFKFSSSFNTGANTLLRNNISYLNKSGNDYGGRAGNTTDHNSWDAGTNVIVSNADFISIDPTNLSGTRQSIGNLPIVSFLHLAGDTDLRAKGIAISGLTLDGDGETWLNPPSLGPFEYVITTTIPVVTTSVISNISLTTASGGGNIIHDGNLNVTARGICWNTSSTPTLTNSYTTNGIGEGLFTSLLSSLNASTHYYVRAYGTNSLGIGYGNEVTFDTSQNIIVTSLPTVTTSAITGITTSSAFGGGNVIHDGSIGVSARGVCWDISTAPTISNSHTSNGIGEGVFTSIIANLNSSTHYYIRAYATNAVGTAYGAEVTLDTSLNVNIPTVTTSPITNISITSATGGGNVTTDGSLSVTARGVCWNTSINPTTANSSTNNGNGLGLFVSTLSGLNSSTHYYVRAYAINSLGIAYGTNIQFDTSRNVAIPTVTTSSITNISTTNASGGGNVIHDGSTGIFAKGVCWNTLTNPTISNSYTNDGTGEGVFISSLILLDASTHYYVRSYASNSVGTGYGNEVTFDTSMLDSSIISVPTLTTNVITNITATTASGGGNVIDPGSDNITEKGICWNTSTNPLIINSHTSNGIGAGPFTSSLISLNPSTHYYVRSYATNSAGTGYGNEVTFDTSIMLISNILVSGVVDVSTITTFHGTLQLITTITPINATIQNVNWIPIGITGTCSIDGNTGLVTALTDGIVDIYAEALDGGGAMGVLRITITGQTSPEDPLYTLYYLTATGKYLEANTKFLIAKFPTPILPYYELYFGLYNDPLYRNAGNGFYGNAYIRKISDDSVAIDISTGNPVIISPPNETFVVNPTLWYLSSAESYYTDFNDIISNANLTLTISITGEPDTIGRYSNDFSLLLNKTVNGYFQ